jgi:biotin carboxyl carrier protein
MISTELVYRGKTYTVTLDKTEGTVSANVDDRAVDGEIVRLTPNCFSIRIGAKRAAAFVARSDQKVYVHIGGQLLEFEEAGSQSQSFGGGAAALGSGFVSSPMPGRVVKIPVTEGQEIDKGQILVIVEAMKMENPLKSSVAGTVKKIHYAEGDLVDAGRPIVEVESAAS